MSAMVSPMHPNRTRSWLSEYIRFQSRYGYEPIMLTLCAIGTLVTAVLLWWMLFPENFALIFRL